LDSEKNPEAFEQNRKLSFLIEERQDETG